MAPEQRREVIARLLADCPDASQRMIADAVGCSQATVARGMAKLAGESSVIRIDAQGDSPPVPQVSRGEALVERLRAEMTEQGLIPTSTEEELLAVVWDLADRIEVLQRMVAVDGERWSARTATCGCIRPCRRSGSARRPWRVSWAVSARWPSRW